MSGTPVDPTVMSHRPRPSIAPCPLCDTRCVLGEACPGCGEVTIDTRIDTVLLGRYRIDALIGSGGMGRVYSALHLALNEAVAVKFLLGEFSTRAEVRSRFKREATVLARLRHPGIVTVLDFGEDQGELFMVMELLRGRSLDKLIAPDVGMPCAHAVALIDEVLAVLADAHAAGVVHRDLKPENVMQLDATGRLKVLDFGIASVQDDPVERKLTRTGSVRGTPHYMSPEQCTGRPIGPPTDVYAVGAMLYEMLAGRTHFTGASAAEIMAQQMYAPVPRFAESGAAQEVPVGLEAIVLRALAKRAEERPTVQEFREAVALAMTRNDPWSEAQTGAAQRAQQAGLTREARALTDKNSAPPTGPLDREMSGRNAAVALWGFSAERAAGLKSAFGLMGVTATVHPGDAPPEAFVGTTQWKALVLAGDAQAEARVAAVRRSPAVGTQPVVVIDVPSGQRSPSLIRAGASDVALDRVDDVAVCQKVLRAIRRGR